MIEVSTIIIDENYNLIVKQCDVLVLFARYVLCTDHHFWFRIHHIH